MNLLVLMINILVETNPLVMKYLFHQEKLLVTKWNFRWDCEAQGDKIKLLQKIFGSKINSSALSIDDFEDNNLYFLVAKILTFVNEKFHWGKHLVTIFISSGKILGKEIGFLSRYFQQRVQGDECDTKYFSLGNIFVDKIQTFSDKIFYH